ncbi:FG-GAP repeat domain-containing protein [Micromonospora sp. DT229]|uniref:FG-GAP repeat domain-containing protein n=1 Tax=Micromonospora sp. DT229 TaxID=3393430 RepID=UPI003CF75686
MSYRRNLSRWGARVLLTVALLTGAVAVAPSTAAHAAVGGFEGVQGGRGWVDFNGDGRADFCTQYGNTELRCSLSNGDRLGQVIRLTNTDQGSQGKAWVDFNGDGRADHCRVAGGRLSCTVSAGTSFGTTYTSGSVDPGWTAGQAWIDFNGDGRADYCRVIGSWSQKVQCTVSTGTGFGATYTSGNLEAGWDAGRGWTDINGDGRADYCRVVDKSKLQCTLSTGTGFGSTFTSGNLDGGWDDSRVWVDFNGDGRADYCRVIGLLAGQRQLQCTVSTGNNFGATYTSPYLDAGYTDTAKWADFNGDGRADYCRQTNDFSGCTVSTGDGFGATYSHRDRHQLLLTVSHGWVDLNGDGRIDHGYSFDGSTSFWLNLGLSWSLAHVHPA